MTDLEKAYAALVAKQRPYSQLWAYYEGTQPVRYATERLQELFNELHVKFTENWCQVVVDAVLDRVNLVGFRGPTDAINTRLAELFASTELGLDSDDAHLGALVCGESFIIAWPGPSGEVQAFYNDPRNCHVQYDADYPRLVRWAAKWWVREDETLGLTLYYPDRLEYYATKQRADNVMSARAFVPLEPPMAPNPFGVVPVFHLRRSRRVIQSELASVVGLQDAVNKLLADMMVAAEFGAFRQRWIITSADITKLKNAPNEIWSVPSGDGVGQPTQLGEFSQTDLSVYLQAMDNLSRTIAVITQTPRHYIFGQSSEPSGEALRTMEAPLVKKCERIIERFSVTWREVASFLLRMDGLVVPATSIETVWDPVRTEQPLLDSQALLLKKQFGVSNVQLQREAGYSEAQIAAMADERAAEAPALGEALLTAFDRGGTA